SQLVRAAEEEELRAHRHQKAEAGNRGSGKEIEWNGAGRRAVGRPEPRAHVAGAGDEIEPSGVLDEASGLGTEERTGVDVLEQDGAFGRAVAAPELAAVLPRHGGKVQLPLEDGHAPRNGIRVASRDVGHHAGAASRAV